MELPYWILRAQYRIGIKMSTTNIENKAGDIITEGREKGNQAGAGSFVKF